MVPEDKIEHEKLARRSANYVVIGKELYKKAASTGILMKCVLCSKGFEFWDFCPDNLIDVYYSLVAHSCCNGYVECANGMVIQSLKSRIFDDAFKYATKWLHELSHVIRGLRTQKSRATGYTPFFMVYGSKAVLPSDVASDAPRIQYYEEGEAEKS
ncbi:uncharacterized protein LOC111257940 [Setaria italica]|uniref:uncharacterized protein LOC111257940 n=1 Tax=Setaria italica TaxID=4555 RepID=UPI000BE4B33E|nr:uncharacterized protein LOC111257940 [Setaria italica]